MAGPMARNNQRQRGRFHSSLVAVDLSALSVLNTQFSKKLDHGWCQIQTTNSSHLDIDSGSCASGNSAAHPHAVQQDAGSSRVAMAKETQTLARPAKAYVADCRSTNPDNPGMTALCRRCRLRPDRPGTVAAASRSSASQPGSDLHHHGDSVIIELAGAAATASVVPAASPLNSRAIRSGKPASADRGARPRPSCRSS